jgi:uncharacterized repeat protein (TIGR03803 family)
MAGVKAAAERRGARMSKLNWVRACGVFLLCATAAVALPQETFTTLHSFNGTHGSIPDAALAQASNGDFYGTTFSGGVTSVGSGNGTVFRITPRGALTTLYAFCSQSGCVDGAGPYARLVQGAGGGFYGTTSAGGAGGCSGAGCGTVFKITPSGVVTTVHSFDGTDGSRPSAGLLQAANGNLYGTTTAGGVNDDGTVFRITPSGMLTTLLDFDGADGSYPYAGLLQVANGDFYGTTVNGGTKGYGTVFKITTSGTLTTLHSFDGADGDTPYSGLVQGTDGKFYGTTYYGGRNDCQSGCGTVFEITPGGDLTSVHRFNGTDGAHPFGNLVQATDGDLYGTTFVGGASSAYIFGCGTVFKIAPSGPLTILYSFCSKRNCTDGTSPEAGLVQDTNGSFYGTTSYGGANTSCDGGQGCGTTFSLTVGLGPFVKTVPTSDAVGAAVNILGNNLTGATKVTFHGTAAAFTMVSSSEITTTVPTGATTGTVKVVTPSRTLSSNVPFRVLP